ncbi:SDR family oxidoreductase [Salininema proteolyticum]|uniref:SDR family oxidoreductase n=1 Tax=Salininema proteolyticum TaxID=1607685 RepID=A0ABV8TYQ0_9ACTN
MSGFTILVFGAGGHLGSALTRRAAALGWKAVSASRNHGEVRVDITDRSAVADTVARVRPDAVVNAAYVQSSWKVTADGAAHVALACLGTDTRFVQISSDAVFSGREPSYAEEAEPDPVTPYGAAKAAAETAARLVPRSTVVRTSWIVGYDTESPYRRLVDDALAGRKALFTDDFRCPIHVDDLSEGVLSAVDREVEGTLHLGGPDALSRHELGRRLAVRFGKDPDALPTGLKAEAIPGSPLDVRLDSRRTTDLLGLSPRSL